MKKFWLISTLALFSIAMTGCELGGKYSGEMTYTVTSSVEQKTGGETILTEYEWDDRVLPAGERQTKNRFLVYEDADYVYDDENFTITCFRTYYQEDGTTIKERHKRVSSYFYNYGRIYKLEVFLMGEGGSETDPIERVEELYTSSGSIEGFKREVNGVLVEENYDYEYFSQAIEYSFKNYTEIPVVEKRMIVTYNDTNRNLIRRREIEVDSKVIQFTEYGYSDATGQSYTQYKTYRVEGEDEILIEEQDNYDRADMSASYDITKYDEHGANPVVTNYEIEYVKLTVKY